MGGGGGSSSGLGRGASEYSPLHANVERGVVGHDKANQLPHLHPHLDRMHKNGMGGAKAAGASAHNTDIMKRPLK